MKRPRYLINRINELTDACRDDIEFQAKLPRRCPECHQTGSHAWRCPNDDDERDASEAS